MRIVLIAALMLGATPAFAQGSKAAALNEAAAAEGCTKRSSKTWDCGPEERAAALAERFRKILSRSEVFGPLCTIPTGTQTKVCEVQIL